MKTYINADWRKLLTNNNLITFDNFWDLDRDFVEEPNNRRGGWSGVSKIFLLNSNGEKKAVYVKRQLNHYGHTYRHPIKGEITYRREMRNFLKCEQIDFKCVTPVFYSEKKIPEGEAAVIVTAALDDYQCLDDWMAIWQKQGLPHSTTRKKIMDMIITEMKKLHARNFQHGTMRGKHTFIKFDGDNVDIRFIDLETLIWRPFGVAEKEISSLHRAVCGKKLLPKKDYVYFYRQYLGIKKIGKKNRKLWEKIESYYNRKCAKQLSSSHQALADHE